MSLLGIIRELGRRLAHLDLTWPDAARYAAAHNGLVDVTRLQQARAELGEEWSGEIYNAARDEAQRPEEIVIDDVTELNDSYAIVSRYPLTANGLVLRLQAMIAANQDVGYMPVGFGADRAPITTVAVEASREAPVGDDDYTLVLK